MTTKEEGLLRNSNNDSHSSKDILPESKFVKYASENFDTKFAKKKTNDMNSKPGKRQRTVSINSFAPEFMSK